MIYQASPEFASLLERAGIRQKELAERIKMSRFSLSHVAARRRNISGAFAGRIAMAYGEMMHVSHEEALAQLFVPVAEKKYEVSNRKRGARGRFAKEAEEPETLPSEGGSDKPIGEAPAG